MESDELVMDKVGTCPSILYPFVEDIDGGTEEFWSKFPELSLCDIRVFVIGELERDFKCILLVNFLHQYTFTPFRAIYKILCITFSSSSLTKTSLISSLSNSSSPISNSCDPKTLYDRLVFWEYTDAWDSVFIVSSRLKYNPLIEEDYENFLDAVFLLWVLLSPFFMFKLNPNSKESNRSKKWR